jgi:hypothetical protein
MYATTKKVLAKKKKIKEGRFLEISFDGSGLALNSLEKKTQGLLPPKHVIEQLIL